MRVPIAYAGPNVVGIFTVSEQLNFSVNTAAGMMTCRGRLGSLLAKLGVACWGRLGTVPRKLSPWWLIEEGRMSYAGSCLDSLLKKVGLPCLGSLLLCTCWFLLLEVSVVATVNDRIAGVGIHWRGKLSVLHCSFCRWLVEEG